MNRRHTQSGFTAVELLITLFVAAAFLVAGYQLFNVVIRDGGQTRAESRAANIAYDYMRKYTSTAVTVPCTESTPLTDEVVAVEGLTNVNISITITCLPDAVNSLSKVEAMVSYNTPQQTVTYATYTNSAGASGTADVTNGLVAWWKMNSDTNNSIGTPNGVGTNISSAPNYAGQNDMAYAFVNSGTAVNSSQIITSSTFGLGAKNVALSVWVNNTTTASLSKGVFVSVGSGSGYSIGLGGSSFITAGNNLIMQFDGVRTMVTTTQVPAGWHHIVMNIDAAGVPSAYLDGTPVAGTYSGAAPSTPSGNFSIIGAISSTSSFFTGSLDDVRLYNRMLPQSDISLLTAAGPM